MLSGSFSIFKWPGTPLGPTEYLEVFVGTIQLVSCQDIVTLTGTVLSDPTGHTYYWEQTAGPAVTWLEPQNQLDVTFQKPAVFVDLFFRLWIDRYTPFQQYKDVIVTGTARDDLTYAINTSLYGSSSTDLPGVSNSFIVPGPSAAGTTTINNPVKTLVWTNPSIAYPSVYTGHQLYTNTGTPVLLATIPITATSYSNTPIPQLNTSYILRTTVDVFGLGRIIQSTNVVVPGAPYDATIPTLDGTDNLTSAALVISNPGASDYFQTQVVSLAQLDAGSDILSSTHLQERQAGILGIFQTQIPTLESIPGTLEELTIGYALNTTIYGSMAIFQVQLSDGITVIG